MTLDETHDPAASSWVAGADGHAAFPVQNLPLGVYSVGHSERRIGCAIGEWVLDLRALASISALPEAVAAALGKATLNALFRLPAAQRCELRRTTFRFLTDKDLGRGRNAFLHPIDDCEMHLPFNVGDYTDFYAGIHHATNVGKLFRPDNPLLPNYKHVPIGYHGRASSVRVSGTPVVRPMGQTKGPDELPVFSATRRLDYEVELGVWLAGDNELGERVPIEQAWTRVGGFCLLNDWSARDVQAWEYQPLGPFLAKSFLSSVSPWVVTAEAIAPFRIAQPPRAEGDPRPLSYLADEADVQGGALSIRIEAAIASRAMREARLAPHPLSAARADAMYWTVAQMVAHHGSNGCDLHAGDLLGTGTISGREPNSLGSLLELSAGGQEPVTLPTGEERLFLEDGDQVEMTATAEREGFRSIGFGKCAGLVMPALG